MPSWMTHFRIADWFLDKIPNLHVQYFIIGNIAPDCGVPTAQGQYEPCTGVTHFTLQDVSNKSDCDYAYIYTHYIKNESDLNKKSFFIGYFVHLFTDCENAVYNCFPIEKKYGKFEDTPGLFKQVKNEYHNIDLSYLKKHGSPSFALFKTYDAFKETYPAWYKNNEIAWQMKNITAFYSHPKCAAIKYKYITPQRIEQFVTETAEKVYAQLQTYGVEL